MAEYYTVSKARTNIKALLDKAKEDKDIFIKRGGLFYKLSFCINQEQSTEDYYASSGYNKVMEWKKDAKTT